MGQGHETRKILSKRNGRLSLSLKKGINKDNCEPVDISATPQVNRPFELAPRHFNFFAKHKNYQVKE
jgi:hypothetical protein